MSGTKVEKKAPTAFAPPRGKRRVAKPAKAEKAAKPTKQAKQAKQVFAGELREPAGRIELGTKKPGELVVGAEPRVDLLPPEVRALRKARALRRRLGFGVIAVIVLVVLGIGLGSVLSLQAQAQLQTERARTQSLLTQQAKFIEVRKLQDEAGLVEAGRRVGMSTEIDWKKYLLAVQATLPANVAINTVTIDAASPLVVYAQATAPLQGARVATLSFTATSPTLPQVPAWLVGLATLPGYADALPGSVTQDDTTKVYTVNITMHINDAAFANRFTTKGK